MTKLRVSISVNNPDQVIVAEKGKWIGFASRFLSKEKRKQKVEEEIYQMVKQELQQILPDKLTEKGISAEVNIEIIE